MRPYEGFEPESIVQTWKSYTSKAIQAARGKTGDLRQDEYFDRIVRDEAELLEKLGWMQAILSSAGRSWNPIAGCGWVKVLSERGGRAARLTLLGGGNTLGWWRGRPPATARIMNSI